MERSERTCPACHAVIEDGESVVFFEGEMYHLACAPGAETWPREPRY
jgi:hypothetical protein